jgi:hypothetical protein
MILTSMALLASERITGLAAALYVQVELAAQ